jgi:hypothetical protein
MNNYTTSIDICTIEDCPAKRGCPNSGDTFAGLLQCKHPEECHYSKRALVKIEIEQ